MGASGWSYYVPYQEDINKAFQELRQKVFEEGDYYKPWELTGNDLEDFDQEFEEPDEDPQTIEELVEISVTEGTHSIIDMERVVFEPASEEDAGEMYPIEGEFGVIYRLATEDLLELFGTDKPTREMIETLEKEESGILDEYAPGRWTGIYVTFYKGNNPDGYFFAGYSGD